MLWKHCAGSASAERSQLSEQSAAALFALSMPEFQDSSNTFKRLRLLISHGSHLEGSPSWHRMSLSAALESILEWGSGASFFLSVVSRRASLVRRQPLRL